MASAHGGLKGVRLLGRREVQGWLLCLPAILIFAVFFLGPAIAGFWISLHEWNGMSPTMQFVGLDNYSRLLETDRFWSAFRVNWTVALSTLITMPLALALALLCRRNGFIMRIYRSAFFSPQVLSIAAAGLLWTLLLSPYQGPLNSILVQLGWKGQPPAWLGNVRTALPSAILVVIWFYFGVHMVLYMAGLAAIPSEYFDAARIETNSKLDELRYVTIPMMRETLLVSFVMIFAGSFGHLIGFFSILTGGGPAGRTELLGIYMTKSAFMGNDFGYASALSVVLLPSILISRARLEY